MIRAKRLLALFLLLLGAPSVLATPHKLLIDRVEPDYERERLLIYGRHFGRGALVRLDGMPLSVLAASDLRIEAELLPVMPGTYRLMVRRPGPKLTFAFRTDVMDVTLGAAGPSGPPGMDGAEGPEGAQGPSGPAGATGDRGDKGEPGAVGAPGPKGLRWTGAWDGSVDYLIDNAVHYEGAAWIALSPSTNLPPAEGDDWSLLVAAGARGETGELGEPGERGEQGEKGDPGVPGIPGISGVNGKDGLDGQPGVSCWDLNESHSCDLQTEDRDGNGVCSPADCFGTPIGGDVASVGSFQSFRVEYPQTGTSGVGDGWSTFTGGSSQVSVALNPTLHRFEIGEPFVDALVLSGPIDSIYTGTKSLTSDRFTTETLAGNVVAVLIEDLEAGFTPFVNNAPTYKPPGLVGLTLVEVGGSEGYEWYDDAVVNGFGTERDILIETDDGKPDPTLRYQFTGCVPSGFRPGPDLTIDRNSFQRTSALSVVCRQVSFLHGARSMLYGWLQEWVDSPTPPLRNVEVVSLDPDEEAMTTLDYFGANPVRYVFPRFDKRTLAPLLETLVLTADRLELALP